MSDETTTESPEATETEQVEQAKPDDKPLGENGEKALKAERTRASAAEKERDALKAELDERLEKLGPPWTLKRLEAVDVSPAGHFRLANLAPAGPGSGLRR